MLLSGLVLPRHIFLFDMAAIVCKRRGDNYEMKEILDLNNFKVTNNPTTDKEGKKVSVDFCALAAFGRLLTSHAQFFFFVLLPSGCVDLQKCHPLKCQRRAFIAVISASNNSGSAGARLAGLGRAAAADVVCR